MARLCGKNVLWKLTMAGKLLCAKDVTQANQGKDGGGGPIPVASKQDFLPNPCYGRRNWQDT